MIQDVEIELKIQIAGKRTLWKAWWKTTREKEAGNSSVRSRRTRNSLPSPLDSLIFLTSREDKRARSSVGRAPQWH